MTFVEPISLVGKRASLRPLTPSYLSDLIEAVCDGELWNLWYTSVPTAQGMAAEIDRRLKLQQEGSMLPFVIIDNANGMAVGMTTYMHLDAANRRLEIGSTWYRKSAQRSPLNTECKLMLLEHAFESLRCIAVEFRTHILNRQSRAGIERLGAKLDGILRQHQLGRGGTLRDTCVYSILDGEWPTVKAHLTYQLNRPRA